MLTCEYGGYYSWKFDKRNIKERLDRVKDMLAIIKSNDIKFDHVIVHGTSGTWLAPLLIMQGHEVVMVRKPGESSHGRMIEFRATYDEEGRGDGALQLHNGVFIDDIIASGSTVKRVLKLLDEKVKVVAVALHDTRTAYPSSACPGVPIFGYEDMKGHAQ